MNQKVKIYLVVSMLAFTGSGWMVVAADELNKSEKQASSAHSTDKQSQQRINKMDDKTRSARVDYLNNERMADVTEAYNRQIEQLVKAQEQELADLQVQLDSIDETDQSVLPMLSSMVDMLGKFVSADLPFLPKERQQRLAKLEDVLLRADVSVAEKYRQILGAYMVEIQYGRTFEAYSGNLGTNGGERQVNFLRLGRTALYYQTLNGKESGLWQPSQQQWQVLSETQNLTLRKALQIARQQKVPELLDMPLPKRESDS